MKFPICDLTYTTEGYVAEPWYAPPFALPDKWLAAIHPHIRTDVRPESPNFLGEKAYNGFLTYCDIIDPDQAMRLIDEGECPPLVCVPEAVRYSQDSTYREAVDKYNAAVVRFALAMKGAIQNVQEG